jgi:hypothetical protein
VFSHKETTSKRTRVTDLQACKRIFPSQRSDTFWRARVLSKPIMLHCSLANLQSFLLVNKPLYQKC